MEHKHCVLDKHTLNCVHNEILLITSYTDIYCGADNWSDSMVKY